MAIDSKARSVLRLLQGQWPDAQYLDEGGNSWVYRVVHDQRPCVVKVLRRLERFDRFRAEVHFASKLSHVDGIVPVLAEQLPDNPTLDDLKRLAFFVSPYVEGGSLKGHLAPAHDGGAAAVDMMLGVARILAELHAMSVAHRDLKPENILLDADGRPVVADYGLCIDLVSDEPRYTHTVEIVGSFYYRAPEYLRGRLDESDHRPGDVFSLGRILWTVLTGKEPEGLTDFEFSRTPATSQVTIRRGTLLDRLVRECTEIDPRMRPQIADVIKVLESWKLEPKVDDVVSIKERIDADPEIQAHRQSDAERLRLMDELRQAATTVRAAFDAHPVALQLRELGDTANIQVFSQVRDNTGWAFNDEAKGSSIEQPTVVAAFQFHHGAAGKHLPILTAQCGFRVDFRSMSFAWEMIAASTAPNEFRQIRGPIQNVRLTALVLSELESAANDAMIELHEYYKAAVSRRAE